MRRYRKHIYDDRDRWVLWDSGGGDGISRPAKLLRKRTENPTQFQ